MRWPVYRGCANPGEPGRSSPALPTLFTNSLTMIRWRRWHARVVIVDSQRIPLTSANLTYHGLEASIEPGALSEDAIVTRTVQLI